MPLRTLSLSMFFIIGYFLNIGSDCYLRICKIETRTNAKWTRTCSIKMKRRKLWWTHFASYIHFLFVRCAAEETRNCPVDLCLIFVIRQFHIVFVSLLFLFFRNAIIALHLQQTIFLFFSGFYYLYSFISWGIKITLSFFWSTFFFFLICTQVVSVCVRKNGWALPLSNAPPPHLETEAGSVWMRAANVIYQRFSAAFWSMAQYNKLSNEMAAQHHKIDGTPNAKSKSDWPTMRAFSTKLGENVKTIWLKRKISDSCFEYTSCAPKCLLLFQCVCVWVRERASAIIIPHQSISYSLGFSGETRTCNLTFVYLISTINREPLPH